MFFQKNRKKNGTQTRTVYFHEDDYCQIEILPVENLGFCLEQAGLIDDFSEAHWDKYGYTDIYMRSDNPVSLFDLKISDKALEETLAVILPRFDEVFTGYSTYREKCEDTCAYGHDEHVVVYFKANDGYVKNIWLTLSISNEADAERALELMDSLSGIGDLIIADWNWSFIGKLSEKSQIRNYLWTHGNLLQTGDSQAQGAQDELHASHDH